MRLKLVPSDTNFDFLKLQKITMVLSAFLVLASIGMFASIGLNLGIDFKGGILLEARSNSGPADISKVRNDLETLNDRSNPILCADANASPREAFTTCGTHPVWEVLLGATLQLHPRLEPTHGIEQHLHCRCMLHPWPQVRQRHVSATPGM